MVIALYGVAFAMVVAGLAALVQGYGIIVVERGWAQVIAGSVVASGGAVLLGVAYAAGRINRLAQETARLRDRLGRGEAAFPPPPPTLGAIPSPVPAAPPAALPASPDPVEPRQASALPIAAVAAAGAAAVLASRAEGRSDLDGDEGSHRPDPGAAGRGSSGEPLGSAETVGPDGDPEDAGPDGRVDLGGRPELQDALGIREPLDLSAPADLDDPVATAASGDAQGRTRDGPADDDLFGEPDGFVQAEPLPLRDTAALPPRDDDLFAPEEDAGRLPDDATPDHGGEMPEAAAPPPAVVGTYSSGGNNYVMYADGAIEADTPAGLFRFASLDELKEFIASGGEAMGGEGR